MALGRGVNVLVGISVGDGVRVIVGVLVAVLVKVEVAVGVLVSVEEGSTKPVEDGCMVDEGARVSVTPATLPGTGVQVAGIR